MLDLSSKASAISKPRRSAPSACSLLRSVNMNACPSAAWSSSSHLLPRLVSSSAASARLAQRRPSFNRLSSTNNLAQAPASGTRSSAPSIFRVSPGQRRPGIGEQISAALASGTPDRHRSTSAMVCLECMLDVPGMPAGNAPRLPAVGRAFASHTPWWCPASDSASNAPSGRTETSDLATSCSSVSTMRSAGASCLARDGDRTLQRERPGEDGETPKNGPLALADQAIAPVQRRTERLVPRRGRTPPAPLQLQPAIEQRRDLPQSVRADPHSGKFDRQRDAVELAANFDKDIGIIFRNVRPMTRRGGSFRKQARRRIAQHLVHAQPGPLRRPRERYELEDLLSLHQQRLAAGRKDADARSLLVNAFRKPGHDLDHVLAAVEDEKQAPVAQETDDAIRRISMVNDKPQRRSDRAGDERQRSFNVPRSRKCTWPSNSAHMSWASAIATVVLPIPPGPLSVTKRSLTNRADNSCRTSSRPTIRSRR